jgi:hypothetical protein
MAGPGIHQAGASYSSLESVIEHGKEAYYLALRRTQTTLGAETPDWEPWLMFFLRSIQSQIKLVVSPSIKIF